MIETEKHVLIIKIIPNSEKRIKPVVAVKAILVVKTSFHLDSYLCEMIYEINENLCTIDLKC